MFGMDFECVALCCRAMMNFLAMTWFLIRPSMDKIGFFLQFWAAWCFLNIVCWYLLRLFYDYSLGIATHMLHAWYICLRLGKIVEINVGKHTIHGAYGPGLRYYEILFSDHEKHTSSETWTQGSWEQREFQNLMWIAHSEWVRMECWSYIAKLCIYIYIIVMSKY